MGFFFLHELCFLHHPLKKSKKKKNQIIFISSLSDGDLLNVNKKSCCFAIKNLCSNIYIMRRIGQQRYSPSSNQETRYVAQR